MLRTYAEEMQFIKDRNILLYDVDEAHLLGVGYVH